MKKIGNTMYVNTPNSYLSLDGENIILSQKDQDDRRYPLHNLEGIITFGYAGASPALMGYCAEKGINLTFMTAHGRFLARVVGEKYGNVLLRKEQYRISDSEERSLFVSKNMIIGKIYNSKSVVDRACRDYPLRIDVERLKKTSQNLKNATKFAREANSLEQLLGFEGEAATQYFGVFDDLILQQKETFKFSGRNKRPPLDAVNALLSFSYSLLAKEVSAALEAVGLDPYVGFLHRDRPGRTSLALDLMEELRAPFADRFVLSLINKKMVNIKGFTTMENGAVIMDEDTRKDVLRAWQEKKKDEIKHPFLEEKMEWGLIPHVQAMLLARYIRGDLDNYPPFLWK